MRQFLLLVFALAVIGIASFSSAQQVDVAVSGSTLFSTRPQAGIETFQQPAEKGGTFAGIKVDFVGYRKRRLGLSLETAWRTKKAVYPENGESYRPIFTDANVLYQPKVTPKIGLDFLAGAGVATTLFYLPSSDSCAILAGGCVNYTNSNHFMEDAGVGVRYYAWRRLFVMPEIRYYHVENNHEFHSANLFRAGISVGFSFGK